MVKLVFCVLVTLIGAISARSVSESMVRYAYLN